jgi:hypothetical protein
MILNEAVEQNLAEIPESASGYANLLPVPMVDSTDVTDAMVYLCGQEVVPGLVEVEVAVPRSRPAVW